MHNTDTFGGVAETAQKENDVGRVDMWGDRVVGSLPKEKPEPPGLDRGIVKIAEGLFLHPDGNLYRHKVTGWRKLSNDKGFVNADGITYNITKLVAENYVPNPANFPHIRKMDGNLNNCKVNNIRWASSAYKSSFTKIAKEAEQSFNARKLIPEIEIPETITIKSNM